MRSARGIRASIMRAAGNCPSPRIDYNYASNRVRSRRDEDLNMRSVIFRVDCMTGHEGRLNGEIRCFGGSEHLFRSSAVCKNSTN